MNGDGRFSFGRFLRLASKELKEIFRDRRTLLTLVLMPLLLYPVLGLALQQFALAGARAAAPIYRIGFRSEDDAAIVVALLELADLGKPKPKTAPTLQYGVHDESDLDHLLRAGAFDLLLRVERRTPTGLDPKHPIALDLRMTEMEGNAMGADAARFVNAKLARTNERLLETRLATLGVQQRADPVRIAEQALASPEGRSGFPFATVLPLVLILMTITGAVYPAIDLTAGERERGTLEMLMAAPIPRMSVLSAKYVAVLAVALATAIVNLAAMTATLFLTDIGRTLLGPAGLQFKVLLQAFAAIALFTAFFAALLLALSSFARSFKEAQAYLIPLMLASLAPGVASLFPWVELTPATALTPILNTVLFTRELLAGRWDPLVAGVVLASNACYAAAALAVAARLFGSEGVLYGGPGSWRGLVLRPTTASAYPPATAAAFVAALAVPGFLFGSGLAKRLFENNFIGQILANSVVSAVVFVVIPAAVAWRLRTAGNSAFALRSSAFAAWPVALLWGVSLWPFALTLRSLALDSGALEDNPEFAAKLRMLVEQLRSIPLSARILLMAVVPAVCEELFFRGFLFGPLMRRGPLAAIGVTAAVFGAFHLLSPSGVTAERLYPTAFLGVALGWLRWRTGSVFPGMVLHALHNGLLVAALDHPGWLDYALAVSDNGFSIRPTTYAVAAACVAVGFVLTLTIWPASRRESNGNGDKT